MCLHASVHGKGSVMADESKPTQSASSFEAGLKGADTSVVSFEDTKKGWLHTLRSILRDYPTSIPAFVLVSSVLVFSFIAVFINPNNFLSPYAISTIIAQVTITGIVAVAQTVIILTAGIDLSVGAILVLSSMVMGKLAVESGIPVYVAVPIGMVVGTFMGWINGVLVTYLRIPPFIVTLGTLNIFNAVKLFYTQSESIRALDIEEKAPGLLWFGNTVNIGQATVIYGTLALIGLAVVVWFMLNHTAWGRHVHAVGDDPDAAMLSGIQTDRTIVSVYSFAGLICGFGAWVAIGRVGSVTPIAFETINLDSITAVVIGGTSLFGGRGSIIGSVLGALIVGVFNTGLSLAGVDDYWQYFAAGCLVIIAVALDQWLRRATQ
jgi:fructose transport system permease protein